MTWFYSISPVLQGLIATLFTYSITALGAAVVFFFKSVNQKILDMMMGFAAGVMIAASFWSLLSPAIELADNLGNNVCLTVAAGFLIGGFFIIGSDIFLSKLKIMEGNNQRFKNSILLTAAVTLHNIPEGLAVGVAFGSVAIGIADTSIIGAMTLAIGIGLQNFPEGVRVALPLRREGISPWKSFLAGQGSGAVEPISGVLGAMFAISVRGALPFALTFSAGAMIAVVCSELIPESFKDNRILASCGVLFGFTVMMVLDVAFG